MFANSSSSGFDRQAYLERKDFYNLVKQALFTKTKTETESISDENFDLVKQVLSTMMLDDNDNPSFLVLIHNIAAQEPALSEQSEPIIKKIIAERIADTLIISKRVSKDKEGALAVMENISAPLALESLYSLLRTNTAYQQALYTEAGQVIEQKGNDFIAAQQQSAAARETMVAQRARLIELKERRAKVAAVKAAPVPPKSAYDQHFGTPV